MRTCVRLLTPSPEEALCAVAAETIQAGEPIALYMGELVAEHDPRFDDPSNMYLYELDLDELTARGYTSSVRLRVDASRKGSKARYINDKWGGGLAERTPNCVFQMVFDGERNEPLVVFFASRRIPKGREIIADYGPDYWTPGTFEGLLAAHQ